MLSTLHCGYDLPYRIMQIDLYPQYPHPLLLLLHIYSIYLYRQFHRKELSITMKIICNKSALQKGVNIVSKAVSNKTTMTILECILIKAQNGIITMTANDIELGIETTIEGTIEEEGILALEAKILSELVRRLPDNFVTLTSDANYSTVITCEKARFNIPGRSGEDFAYLPAIESASQLKLSQFTLKEIIRQTIFSIDENASNKQMAGELIEVKNNELRIVSLDGHRISIRKIQLKDSFPAVHATVPGKTLNEVSKILQGDIESEVTLSFTHNHVMFQFDNTTVVSRLVEGQYFKIDQMLNSDHETEIIINKKELLSCIDRATLLIKESDKKPIIMNVTDSTMEVKLKSAMGSMKEEVGIEKNGKDIMIGFNPKFLMDALRVIDDEVVHIYMINAKAPCYIRDENQSYIYLILPVTFSNI